jgi:hypothetical protein
MSRSLPSFVRRKLSQWNSWMDISASMLKNRWPILIRLSRQSWYHRWLSNNFRIVFGTHLKISMTVCNINLEVSMMGKSFEKCEKSSIDPSGDPVPKLWSAQLRQNIDLLQMLSHKILPLLIVKLLKKKIWINTLFPNTRRILLRKSTLNQYL